MICLLDFLKLRASQTGGTPLFTPHLVTIKCHGNAPRAINGWQEFKIEHQRAMAVHVVEDGL